MTPTATQTTADPNRTLPLWAQRDWETVCQRVKGTTAALRLWERVLTTKDRQRLGDDLEKAYFRYRGAVGMWRQLRGVSVPRAVVAVALQIGFLDAITGQVLLRELGEKPDDPADAVEAAVASGEFVLVEVPRQAFWDGKLIEVDWMRYTSQWGLLWALARASKGNSVVDACSLRERDMGDPKFVTKRKCRLVNAVGFPWSLADLVVSAGRGSYRIDLLPDRIRVFERGVGDSVREWLP